MQMREVNGGGIATEVWHPRLAGADTGWNPAATSTLRRRSSLVPNAHSVLQTQSGGRVSADLAQLREVVGQVTGSVFFGAMLAQSRESRLKGAYGHGGRGEEVFSAQLHGILAERAGTASGNNIAEQLYRRLEHQQALVSRSKAPQEWLRETERS